MEPHASHDLDALIDAAAESRRELSSASGALSIATARSTARMLSSVVDKVRASAAEAREALEVWKASQPDLPEVNHAHASLLQAIQIAEAAKVAELEAEQVAADAAIEGAEAAAMEVRALLEPEIADSVVLSSRQALSNDLAAARAALARLPPADGPSCTDPTLELAFENAPGCGVALPCLITDETCALPLGDLAPGIIALTAPLRLVSKAQSCIC